MKAIKVFSPATIGNIGPGFDVLGLAVRNLGDVVEAHPLEGGEIRITVDSAVPLSSDPKKNTAALAAANVFKYLNIRGGIDIILHKGLPVGSGLGSSAASAAAIVNTKITKAWPVSLP